VIVEGQERQYLHLQDAEFAAVLFSPFCFGSRLAARRTIPGSPDQREEE
jgi:hypothetical protein